MHIELDRQDAAALRDILQEKVTQLDRQIGAAENPRFKGELRKEEHQVERILGAVTVAIEQGPSEWEPRDNVNDAEGGA